MALVLSASELKDIADQLEIDYDAVRTDYSGRGMYGAECVGFDLECTEQIMLLALAIAEAVDLETSNAMGERVKVDSMGLGIIAYFPGVTCSDDWDWN